VQAAYQAPSHAIARELAAGIVADYSREQERGVTCFMDDFESCIAHLRFPVTHRRAIRTTDEMDKRFLSDRDDDCGNRCTSILLFGRAAGRSSVPAIDRLLEDTPHPFGLRWTSLRPASRRPAVYADGEARPAGGCRETSRDVDGMSRDVEGRRGGSCTHSRGPQDQLQHNKRTPVALVQNTSCATPIETSAQRGLKRLRGAAM
jgi:hypothetical protein